MRRFRRYLEFIPALFIASAFLVPRTILYLEVPLRIVMFSWPTRRPSLVGYLTTPLVGHYRITKRAISALLRAGLFCHSVRSNSRIWVGLYPFVS